VEENLKSLRLIHQVIIGVSAAILAFALSPEIRPQYESALAELNALRRLEYEDYASFVNETLNSRDPQVIREVQEQYKAAFKEITDSPISEKFNVRFPLHCPWPQDNATVEDYISFFKGDNKIEAILGTNDRLAIRESIEKALKNVRRGRSKGDEIVSNLPQNTVLLSISFALPNKSPDHQIPTQGLDSKGSEVFRQLPQKELEEEVIYLSFEYVSADGDKHYLVASAPISPRTFELVGPHAKNWLVSKPEIHHLIVQDDDGQEIFFKNVRAFSNQLSGMKPTEAARFLQERLDSARREITFLGISVEERVAVWTGPSLILILLSYFLAHLWNLPRVETDEKKDALTLFPWIGLFPDALSKAFTYITVAFVPAVSGILLLLRSGHWPEIPTLIGGLMNLLSVALGIWAVREIRRIEHQHKPTVKDGCEVSVKIAERV
jgi:hypothetical protein